MSIDGIISTHGKILIMTTNHIEKLDSALIRPGRIDLKIEVGYVNNEILKKFLDKFFPNHNINVNELHIKSQLTVAMLQNMVLRKLNINDIIKEICI